MFCRYKLDELEIPQFEILIVMKTLKPISFPPKVLFSYERLILSKVHFGSSVIDGTQFWTIIDPLPHRQAFNTKAFCIVFT